MELFDINRCALIISPSRALLSWAISENPSLAEEIDLDDNSDLSTVYLIPDFGDIEDADDWIEDNAEDLLETLFEEWIPDDSLWPENMDMEQLEKYADFSVSNIVIDTLDASYDED